MSCASCALFLSSQKTATAPGCPRSLDGKLDPVPDRGILRLAHPEDIPFFHLLLQQGRPGSVHGADRPVSRSLERLVVGTVLLRLLRHKTDVRNGSDGRRIKCSVFLAILYDGPIRRRVTPIGNHRLRVLQLSVRTPHFPRVANDDRHGRVDDDIARHMQVRDALGRIDHRECRPILVHGLDVRLDFRPFRIRQFLYFHVQIAQAVVGAHAQLFQYRRVLVENVFIEDRNRVPEHDRVGYFHHGRLEVQRQEHAGFFRILDLLFIEFPQGADIHHRRVDHFAFQEVQLLFQDGRFPVAGDELDPYLRRFFHRNGFFTAVKIPAGHMGDMSF